VENLEGTCQNTSEKQRSGPTRSRRGKKGSREERERERENRTDGGNPKSFVNIYQSLLSQSGRPEYLLEDAEENLLER
jgi:hypothetical protein